MTFSFSFFFFFMLAKDSEIRAAVEHIERQLDVAKKSWLEYQERARVAEVRRKKNSTAVDYQIHFFYFLL